MSARAPVRNPTGEQLRAAETALREADPVIGELVDRFGRCRIRPADKAPFDTLIGSIVGQQLSTKAAATIHARLMAAAGRNGAADPAALLSLDDDTLRGVGLSRAKDRYVRAAAQAQQEGELDWNALARLDDEQAISALIQLPGVGRWTAEMLLIFALGRLDVYAVGDLGLRRAVEGLYRKGKPVTDLGLKRITNRWRPYRSVASWYLWRYLDGETTLW